MSRREDFAAAMSDWDPQNLSHLRILERRCPYPQLEPKSVVTITGPRRAGKTYFMYSLVRRLTEREVDPGDILFVNFEHERLGNLTARDLEAMLTTFYEIASTKPRPRQLYIFLDEIQNVQGWGKWVRRMHDRGGARLFLSGSSSRLLSREMATELRGRSIDYLVFPFSFAEFMDARGVDAPDMRKLPHLEERGRILSLLREYLEVGGYPEIVLEQSSEVRGKLLRSYYDTILYRDLIERFGVKSPAMLESFLRLCVANHSKYLSASKAYNYLRSLGFKTRKQTVLDYLRYAAESYVIVPLEIYSRSIKNRAQYPKKLYVVDSGLVGVARFETSVGRLMENLVALELARRSSYFSEFQVHYWKEYGRSEGAEVDFVVLKGGKVARLIQVTFASSAREVEKREVEALKSASEELHCKDLTILTWDYRDHREGVRYIPLWEWLLGADDGE